MVDMAPLIPSILFFCLEDLLVGFPPSKGPRRCLNFFSLLPFLFDFLLTFEIFSSRIACRRPCQLFFCVDWCFFFVPFFFFCFVFTSRLLCGGFPGLSELLLSVYCFTFLTGVCESSSSACFIRVSPPRFLYMSLVLTD